MSKINSFDDLKFDESNPNRGNEKGRKMIKASIKKFGGGRSVLADKNGSLIAGNHVTQEAKEAGLKIRVIETTGDELVVVQRTDLDINEPAGRELSLMDNYTAKTNIAWDKGVLKEKFDDKFLKDLDLDVKEIKSVPLKWLPDLAFKSTNEFEIPDLLPELEAVDALTMPVVAWGSQKRGGPAGTIHFYVDDYRFQSIWDKPRLIIDSGCTAIIEPNISTDNQLPVAYGLYLIFKKRWFSRLMQSFGIRVYVDIHVSRKFRALNFKGVPPGWRSFATRGYSEEIDELLQDIKEAKEFAGTDKINMLVYGGGPSCKEVAEANGCVYLEPFTSKY